MKRDPAEAMHLKFELVLHGSEPSVGADLVLVATRSARDAYGSEERTAGLDNEAAGKRCYAWQAGQA